ncbi:hypothetical protein GOC16_08310 [Sinorhizobium meliloti]|nr:hypothetical protein [Sinorhizobium meliloti]
MNILKPAAYDKDVLYAFRALFDGKATEGQQKRAIEWLVLNACHIGLPSFASTDRETAFLEGQRSIGLQIAKLREPEALALITPKTRGKAEAQNDRGESKPD